MALHARASGAQCIAGYPFGGGSRKSKTIETVANKTVGFTPTFHHTNAGHADEQRGPTMSVTTSVAPDYQLEPTSGSQGVNATLDDRQHREQTLAPLSVSESDPDISRNLAKTKLCFDFRRGRCKDLDCKFAHGHSELRLVKGVHKTSLCRWWAAGKCRADDSCRYAHGEEELRCTILPNSEHSAIAASSGDLQVDDSDSRAVSRSGDAAHCQPRPNPNRGDVVLRVKGTFLEVAPADAGLPLMKRLSRTWSDDGPGRCAQRTMCGGKFDEACDRGVSTRTESSFSSRSTSFVSDMPMVQTNSSRSC